jgi:predicted enzyme related to lactoylglutathione lyase
MDTPKMGEICWTELATDNVLEAKKFYGQVFGWAFSEHDVGEMTYTMIKCNGKEFGGIWSIPKDQQGNTPPHWMSYILVENLETSLKKAQSHGAEVIKSETKVGDFGRLAVIKDPTGAHIALWQNLM